MADLITKSEAELNPYLMTMAAGSDKGIRILASLISSASLMIQRHCNREFVATAYTHYFDGNGAYWLYLRETPITALTSVDLVNEDDGTLTSVTLTDLHYKTDTGKLYYRNKVTYWTEGLQNIKVVYTAGAVPEVVKEACRQLMAWLHRSSISDPNMKSEKMGDYSYTRMDTDSHESAIPDNIREMLGPYRKPFRSA